MARGGDMPSNTSTEEIDKFAPVLRDAILSAYKQGFSSFELELIIDGVTVVVGHDIFDKTSEKNTRLSLRGEFMFSQVETVQYILFSALDNAYKEILQHSPEYYLNN